MREENNSEQYQTYQTWAACLGCETIILRIPRYINLDNFHCWSCNRDSKIDEILSTI